MVKYLLSKEVDFKDKKCLSLALQLYHDDVVRTLLSAGSDLNFEVIHNTKIVLP